MKTLITNETQNKTLLDIFKRIGDDPNYNINEFMKNIANYFNY